MIEILKDDKREMMQINHNGECVFYGNHWDFQNCPEGIAQFLNKLGHRNIRVTDAVLED